VLDVLRPSARQLYGRTFISALKVAELWPSQARYVLVLAFADAAKTATHAESGHEWKKLHRGG